MHTAGGKRHHVDTPHTRRKGRKLQVQPRRCTYATTRRRPSYKRLARRTQAPGGGRKIQRGYKGEFHPGCTLMRRGQDKERGKRGEKGGKSTVEPAGPPHPAQRAVQRPVPRPGHKRRGKTGGRGRGGTWPDPRDLQQSMQPKRLPHSPTGSPRGTATRGESRLLYTPPPAPAAGSAPAAGAAAVTATGSTGMRQSKLPSYSISLRKAKSLNKRRRYE